MILIYKVKVFMTLIYGHPCTSLAQSLKCTSMAQFLSDFYSEYIPHEVSFNHGEFKDQKD